MFNKPFGSNTSGFGSFNTSTAAASPFGSFKPNTATSAFGAPPAFGSTPAQPASTGLFGASNTSTGLFGSTTSTAAPAFGASSSGFGFGGGATSGGLFSNNTSAGGLFPQAQNTNAFQAKPQGFGFGSTATTGTTGGGLFGTTNTGGGLFGQQTNTLGGGLFSNNAGTFGGSATAAAGAGSAHVKYSPVVGTDIVVKSGNSQTINIKHHCITCMKEYENKSLEELRLEDYQAGRKGSSSSVFGFQQPDNKPMFPAFGQATTTTASSVFGGGALGTTAGFGQTNTFSFGSNAQNTTNTSGGLFGAAKPAFGATTGTGTGLFGATTTQAAPTFGTTTPSFGFGATTQNQPGGLFGAKPATTGFGTTPSSGFGSFGAGGGGLFGAKPQTSAPAFGTTTPAFGTLSGSFGTNTSTASGGLFGANNTFGKPATSQPAFGFNAGSTGLGTGLGGGLGTNTFGKPGGFGTLGGGSLFNNPLNNSTNTGLGGGLGGGMFGNTSSLGGSALGANTLGANNSFNANNSLSGASAAGNVHEQILTLVARPYGDSPLFKDLPNDPPPSSEVLKPTNPAAVKAVLDASNYRVANHNTRLKLHHTSLTNDKKSLFDGLEESDASLEDKLSLKPSRKRLVLRSRANTDASENERHRSVDEAPHNTSVNGVSPHENDRDHADRPAEQMSNQRDGYGVNQNGESIADRHGSWLSGSRHNWSAEKDKPTENISPRLYPDLEKEGPSQTLERRASWLTTKPLRKPLTNNPDAAENSVRELAVCPPDRGDKHNSHDKENLETFSGSAAQFLQSCCRGMGRPACADCQRIALQLSSVLVSTEEEQVAPREMPPHPTGVKLTRPGYYTIPTLDEMIKYMRPDGSCVVPHLTIGRKNYGNVYYDCEINVAGLDLDSLVHFLNKEVTVYPDDSDKPPVGEGLNRRAVVTLDRIWPRDKTEKKPITDPDRLLAMDYEGKLRRVCDKHDTKFIEYRPQTGSWVFRVEHFSKYSLTDSDEEDDLTPEVLKRQLVNNQMQKAAPIAPPKPPAQVGLGGVGSLPPGLTAGLTPTNLPSTPSLYPALPISSSSLVGTSLSAPTLSGSGSSRPGPSGPGLSGPGLAGPGLAGPGLDSPALTVPTGHEDLYAMHQTSLNLLNGHKAFEMDTTEDNNESQSLYQDSHKAFGVKSPTSELARLEHRQSHNVQLMKASLYTDTEMEDDVSVSTGDQMVPRGATLLSYPARAPSVLRTNDDVILEDVSHTAVTEEVAMKPLMVRPHTIVLKYHRKVPPFKQTIAGRLEAACIADMSVCRARHSRAGFGPRGVLVYPTSYDAVSHLPPSTELCNLGRYVAGRVDEDWSEPVVVRLALGQDDSNNSTLSILSKHLETLLEYSTFEECDGESVPRLSVVTDPKQRRAALAKLTSNYNNVSRRHAQFGVSNAYCHDVFRLCEALWGDDLENDGIAGTDEASIVNRHKKLLEWMTDAVADITDEELKRPQNAEPNDESDLHSANVWRLMVGGRVLEACRLCVKHEDYNLAAIIAQSSGEPAFRSLLSRQLSLWRECGAEGLLSPYRRAVLRLAAGQAKPIDELADLDWLRALHATARYICPQVSSLEHIVRTYESLFSKDPEKEEVDLTTVETDEMGMKLPLPPYKTDFDVTVIDNCKQRRVLDLRYELIRARAFNTRPRLQPAAYTPDPMDYSLCFLIGAWQGWLSPTCVTGAAAQLEAAGLWHLAAQLLHYHPNDIARNHLILSLVSRHAPASPGPELAALQRLRVPQRWLRTAQAHRAKYQRQPALEAEHLIAAEQWNAAHKVVLEELMPDAVLTDNLQSIAPLLEKLHEAAQRNEVSGWESGGLALYQYIHVVQEIRGLVGSAEGGPLAGDVSARLAALRGGVWACGRALGRLRGGGGARARAARAECGARLLQLALAAGDQPQHLAALLQALRLPPDCTTQVTHKITTDLADQASEVCIESENSSPISSHHRPTQLS